MHESIPRCLVPFSHFWRVTYRPRSAGERGSAHVHRPIASHRSRCPRGRLRRVSGADHLVPHGPGRFLGQSGPRDDHGDLRPLHATLRTDRSRRDRLCSTRPRGPRRPVLAWPRQRLLRRHPASGRQHARVLGDADPDRHLRHGGLARRRPAFDRAIVPGGHGRRHAVRLVLAAQSRICRRHLRHRPARGPARLPKRSRTSRRATVWAP